MTSSQLVTFLDELAGLPCVEAAGWRVREKRFSQERYGARNQEIRRRYQAGEGSYGILAIDYGLKRSAIGKIVRAGRKKCVQRTKGHTSQG
jgi:hypothetical protein